MANGNTKTCNICKVMWFQSVVVITVQVVPHLLIAEIVYTVRGTHRSN